ncbi:MAG: CDP-diacylglycerol--glycerol-3-phosphate 3-phosphatidyltransferase [Tissierellia bacterium]|nr:CDP-diacylglycerol--glycerol-3-phosphate 3-phosphatidyltransferase [Tissierellia bacterium]
MNLPNRLTMLRILAVPIYFYLALYTDHYVITLMIFLVAAFTDFLDGYIARKWGLVTSFGKLMDPLADKFLTITAFTVFTSQLVISPVILLIVTLREILISVFRAVAASKNVVIAAGIYGKIKTVLQMVVIIILHLQPIMGFEKGLFVDILIWSMALMTLLSAFDYLWKNKEVLKE